MTKIEQLEFLNSILTYLLNPESDKRFINIFVSIENKPVYINLEIYKAAIDKLMNDGYILMSPTKAYGFGKDIDTIDVYFLSYKGMFFINDGGYVTQHVVDSKSAVKLLKVEKQTKFLNRVLVVGTAVAAIYYTIQILIYFGCIHAQRTIFEPAIQKPSQGSTTYTKPLSTQKRQ